jgi:hypothetical protein
MSKYSMTMKEWKVPQRPASFTILASTTSKLSCPPYIARAYSFICSSLLGGFEINVGLDFRVENVLVEEIAFCD